MLVSRSRRVLAGSLVFVGALAAGAATALLGLCGPFIDVSDAAFCPFILEVFTLGITTGTTPTTYDPAANVSRTQMAAFLARSVDASLKRGSRRAAMNQFWTAQTSALGVTTLGGSARILQFDGADVWGAVGDATVARVRGSDGRLLESWTGATHAFGLVVAVNRILVTGQDSPGKLYMIDPTQPAGAVTTVASNLGVSPTGIAFDGARLWTANTGPAGSVSIITPQATVPWTVTTFSVGIGATTPAGIVYDGANIWVTDSTLGTLLKLNASGGVLQTVTLSPSPIFPVFDGTNIWVPIQGGSKAVAVVRASNGVVLQTLTGNGLDGPAAAAFDGERVLVTNITGNRVSLFKAADLSPLGFVTTGPATLPEGACSDGARFWVGLITGNRIVRF